MWGCYLAERSLACGTMPRSGMRPSLASEPLVQSITSRYLLRSSQSPIHSFLNCISSRHCAGRCLHFFVFFISYYPSSRKPSIHHVLRRPRRSIPYSRRRPCRPQQSALTISIPIPFASRFALLLFHVNLLNVTQRG